MNPDNSQQPQGENPNLQKLEGDLEKLSQEAKSPETAPVAPTAQDPEPKPKSGLLKVAMVLMAIAVLALAAYVAGNIYLGRKTQGPTPSPEATVTPTPEATANWLTYRNEANGFELKYPPSYKIVEDKYGWPKAVLLLYKGGQSYDLVVEIWDSEAGYKAKYQNQLDAVTVKEIRTKFVTFLNMNKDPEVNQIISTVQLVEPPILENVSPSASPSATPTY